ncbi:TAXI family TRAP transporter solute-binding subunit [Bradyrhizobium sp. S69]|uniref:TAXI family TRAP transporter solute-binding subunit n=1 Tax=Bradyrhizobium sp. S69 TaxID=1641856 RepID=UPI00131AEE3F|nr:TAXI family TRAP transporter solute-binding subunit [Bradyrhizobium sp. S69]
MTNLQITLPFWVRAILLAGVFCIVAGAGLISYRYYMQPKTLTIAVGSLDGQAKLLASAIAGRLATTDSPIRLKVENAGSVLDAAKAFDAGTADLAVVRADVGDLQQARAVALTGHGVVMIVAPPGSPITSIAKLRDHTVGVVGGEINHGVVEVLKKEYDLGHANVTFKDVVPSDARRAIQAKEVSVLLMVLPLTERYLTLVKSLFRESPNSAPVLIPIDSAGAITDVKGPYESFDIPKGTLRGAPPVPDDDVTTLRVGFYLIANRHLSASLVGELAKKLMSVRRDLIGEQPLLAGIAAPDTDSDAFLAVHPGAAAFYNGTQESFMDRYGNAIYLTPMVLGAMASVFAAAWRFLGVRPLDPSQTTLGALCSLPGRVRKTDDEAELAAIEEEIDHILHAQLARSADSDASASETHALIAAAHRLDNLIHRRRMALAAQAQPRAEPSSPS